jgi:hypothetical protein
MAVLFTEIRQDAEQAGLSVRALADRLAMTASEWSRHSQLHEYQHAA